MWSLLKNKVAKTRDFEWYPRGCQMKKRAGADLFLRWQTGFKLKSLILAQIERWRNALHMQVERQHGLRSGGEWRTGE